MIYAFTRGVKTIVRTAVLNNNLTSFTVINANTVNDIQKLLNNNTLTHLRIYY